MGVHKVAGHLDRCTFLTGFRYHYYTIQTYYCVFFIVLMSDENFSPHLEKKTKGDNCLMWTKTLQYIIGKFNLLEK